ncbi:MAG TPA: PilZ domain-containing protein [Humisphaera sp.]
MSRSLDTRRPPVVLQSPVIPDRRRDSRRPLQTRGTIVVLDGPDANSVHDVLTRDMSFSGVSFQLKLPLSVGMRVRLEVPGPGNSTNRQVAEVVRSRPLSNGKFEMAVQFRKM